MLAFKGPVHGQPDRPLNDPLSFNAFYEKTAEDVFLEEACRRWPNPGCPQDRGFDERAVQEKFSDRMAMQFSNQALQSGRIEFKGARSGRTEGVCL